MPLNIRQRFVKAIAKLLRIDYYANPTKLDDNADDVFIWQLDGDVSQREAFGQHINQSFIKQFGHEPKALHIVVEEPDDLDQMKAADFENKIKPWLKKEG